MLGSAVGVANSGVGGPLLRPRSADNLAHLSHASSLPQLDDLEEAEVFVGSEDEELAISGEVQQGEEICLSPGSQLSNGDTGSQTSLDKEIDDNGNTGDSDKENQNEVDIKSKNENSHPNIESKENKSPKFDLHAVELKSLPYLSGAEAAMMAALSTHEPKSLTVQQMVDPGRSLKTLTQLSPSHEPRSLPLALNQELQLINSSCTPDLLSPECEHPTDALCITYHEVDGMRLPLDAVKEEVEAEAEEAAIMEASMQLSSGPGSLGINMYESSSAGLSSMTSSVVSNTSLDDTTTSSRTDTYETVMAAPPSDSQKPASPPAGSSPSSTTVTSPSSSVWSTNISGMNPAVRPSNRDANRISSGASSARSSPTSPRSSGRSSPRDPYNCRATPELRRKSYSSRNSSPGRGSPSRGGSPSRRRSPRRTGSPRRGTSPRRGSPSRRMDSPRFSSPRRDISRTGSGSRTSSAPRSSPRCERSKADKVTQRGSSTPRTSNATDRKSTTVKSRDTQRMDKSASTPGSKESESSGTWGRRKKTVDNKDAKDTKETIYGTLGRKKKEVKSEKEEVAEKYGTLGRRRKTKDSSEGFKDEIKLGRESKATLDTYATLPRRRAREMSARWREQHAAEEEASKTSVRRSKSIGKTDSSSRGRSSPMSSSLPPHALSAQLSRNSPRTSSNSTQSRASPTGRKERTIICMETSVQTILTGGDVTTALQALSRQNSSASQETEDTNSEGRTSPRVTIIRETPATEESQDKKRSVEVQVELAWRLGEGELPEHVRRLTEEHSRLQAEHSRARARLQELENVGCELERMRSAVREERQGKEEVQSELDRTSCRVKDMLASMEGVEQGVQTEPVKGMNDEFNSRGDSLIELENQLHQSASYNIQMTDRMNQYQEYTFKLKKDLDKSVAAQKTLLQQVQDLENEGREMVDFMAEEKNALSECLRELESEHARVRDECQQLVNKVKLKDDEVKHLMRLAEERRSQYLCLQSEMSSVQSKARELMVCQGAQVSGSSVALANLAVRLQTLIGKLVQDYSITESDLDLIVTPNESDSSNTSSTNVTPEHKSPLKVLSRTPSPRKTASFLSALLNAMHRPGPSRAGRATVVYNGNKQVTEGRNSPEGSESHDTAEVEGGNNFNATLSDQVIDVDVLLTRFLKVCCVLKNDTDGLLSEIEDENERLCQQIRSQQQIIDQQHSDYENLSRCETRAKRELAVATRDLDLANQALTKYYHNDYEMQVKTLEEEVRTLSSSKRHIEALHTEKERQLEESLTALAAQQQGTHTLGHIPETQYRQETNQLSDKVASLRQSVIERDRRISELSERHSQDLTTIREAQIDAQRCNRRLTTTIDHVLKTLESVPDIVSANPTLKQLFNTLAQAEKSSLTNGGNANTKIPYGNGFDLQDLNANPPRVVRSTPTSPVINNKNLPSINKAETHL
ncbi:unnamed protein product [Meganyctiphanes norvegica]|uniref:Uncharacterized protein n=1 Tax=Meganyctiphanes norvegica TaxID=48144 RepID=A0AAV2Q7R7_MEGNR